MYGTCFPTVITLSIVCHVTNAVTQFERTKYYCRRPRGRSRWILQVTPASTALLRKFSDFRSCMKLSYWAPRDWDLTGRGKLVVMWATDEEGPELCTDSWDDVKQVSAQSARCARARALWDPVSQGTQSCMLLCCYTENCCNSYKVESTDSKYVEMYWIFCIEFTFVMLGLGVMVKLHYSTWAVWLSLSSSYQQNHANISNLSNCGDSWSHYSGTGMGQARLWKLCGTWAKW